ncbi:metal-dependent hydrolase [Okeania sp. SIO1I7]|uniref:metal-dependent hydrolase n=1 Tax=Okeania sp. SIO1I7 TaxID=2607772 RepID=UPI0013F73EBF|nr:metal-dependent hydrolase [Okeania sp. SIO1I7]NET29238.1 metal-dependent hydrolase [Okeania sp. SIO1I7]
MPSPIAHSVSGYVLAKFLPKKLSKDYASHWWNLGNFYPVFVAIFPDFDFLPQLITGERFHRGITHTLIFAIGFSLIVGWLISYFRKSSFKKILLFTFIIYSSHLLLDLLTAGGSGVQLLWPLTDTFFKSTISVFPAVHHSRGVFDLSHFIFIAWELSYSVLIVSILWLWNNCCSSKFSE